jgi:hypothetical protein
MRDNRAQGEEADQADNRWNTPPSPSIKNFLALRVGDRSEDTQPNNKGYRKHRGLLSVKEPEAAQRDANADRRREREDELHDELPVLHPQLLSETFDLNGHEAHPWAPTWSRIAITAAPAANTAPPAVSP